ncbi:heparinase II/III domain-containing protein [Actinomadura roseirufa]|uniref:heparinase II/III domain-containing protein n=1 Tax=Actinomadura roseirufa TaxID=2094049 RepID=UPI001040EB90|nr:heparinase II/III family protein [Actinomadura roseirufa]
MYRRSRRRIHRAGGAALALALSPALAAACGTTGGAEPPLVPPERVVAASQSKAMCLGYNGLEGQNPVAEVRAGRFRAPGLAPVRVATGTDVDWGLDPYHDRTWQLWLHSLEWLGGAIRAHERSGDRAALETAAGIAQDWLKDNGSPERFSKDRREAVSEGTKFRLATLVCLRRRYSAPWLDRAIAQHAEWLARPEHYSGPWNHGTDESMILMTAGCGIGRADLAEAGYRRLLEAILDPPGGARPAIDAEGADNEQSTHYTVYNRSRWRLAFDVMRTCGRSVPAELERRRELMDEFIAFQSTPGGDMLQIGESYAARASELSRPGDGLIRYVATGGRKGRRPPHRTRVYEAGYLMGRSGWGGRGGRRYADEMAYTARFGPGRYAHGQNDHMALTFHALGSDILVPSGHIGYSDPPWQAWLRSPEAHNTLVVPGARFSGKTPTALTAHRFARGADTFRFADTAFEGTTRSRSVLAASDPDALVVLDEARSATPRVAEQLWHLPATFSAVPSGTGAVATAGGLRVDFLRIPLPGTRPQPTRVVQGSLSPPQGWMVPSSRRTLRAPTVALPEQGTLVRTLTLIAPTRDGRAPAVRTVFPPGGGVRVEAEFAGRRLGFEVAADGTLRRLP